MPANFTEEQRKVIRNSLLTIGYDLIREVGLKKMKVSLIAERAEIATGTFYHFFESKETYVSALIEEQEKVWKDADDFRSEILWKTYSGTGSPDFPGIIPERK